MKRSKGFTANAWWVLPGTDESTREPTLSEATSKADLLAVAQRLRCAGRRRIPRPRRARTPRRRARQTGNVDDRLALRIVAGDHARQHGRIDLARVRRNQRDARAVESIFCQGAQHPACACPAPIAGFASRRLELGRFEFAQFLALHLAGGVMGSASMNSISRGYS